MAQSGQRSPASGHTSAHVINPEAGDHPISADPVEQAAAIAATRRSWREFPYYPRRYGERGWRFSLSDSGWIETLCNLSLSEAQGQVIWLGGLLAARGMPFYLLERHLEHLHDELARSAPARAGRYEILRECAAALCERRVAQISATAFEALNRHFERTVGQFKGAVGNMGRVIVAAVADERAGVAGAVASVAAWACDPDIFEPAWIEAVNQTIADARTHAG